jgi:hypothetical protein
MNAKRMSFALATCALLSTGSAFAQSVDVNAGPVGLTVGPSPVVSPVSMGTRLVHDVFTPPHAWFDLSVLGMGISIGARKNVVQVGSTPSAMFGGTRILESAAVIPGSVTVGNAIPVQASLEGPKPLAHVDLFGMRLFRMGSVNPRLDMRDK